MAIIKTSDPLVVNAAAHKTKKWPPFEDINALLPTSAWHDDQSLLVGHIHEDLYNKLVLQYVVIEHDRARFIDMNKIAPCPPLTAEEAEALKRTYNELGPLRRELGAGGGFPDEIQAELDAQIAKLEE